MIKYLGSKRRLVPVLEQLAAASGASSALDLFTGTTRVAQAFKRRGLAVTAVDTARYAEVFARCYIETDHEAVELAELDVALAHLGGVPPREGYVTETFCRRARYFQPANGARIDAIRDAIESDFAGSWLHPLLLTSLIEAADRVDSTVGLQMAYVKRWAERSYRPLELRRPLLLRGGGRALRGDALELAPRLGHFDLAYLDPPYNQHSYYANYHVWETLVAWDAPDHYGVACKRADTRHPANKSRFNAKKTMRESLERVVAAVDTDMLILSYNDESWMGADELRAACGRFPAVEMLAFDSARYVGARLGIHGPSGARVGTVGRLRNREWVVVAGPAPTVQAMVSALGPADPLEDDGPGTGPVPTCRSVPIAPLEDDDGAHLARRLVEGARVVQ